MCTKAERTFISLAAAGRVPSVDGCGNSVSVKDIPSASTTASIASTGVNIEDFKVECFCDVPTPAPTASPTKDPGPIPPSPPPTPYPTVAPDESTDVGLCFSEVATVMVQGMEDTPVKIKDLKVGQSVWTGNEYSPVYAFGHYHPTRSAEFYQFDTDMDRTESSLSSIPLEMTAEHLVWLKDQPDPVRADSVKVGDVLWCRPFKTSSKQKQQPQPKEDYCSGTVSHIAKITRNGLYAPLTANGKLVVDGIQVSSYISLESNKEQQHFQSTNVRIASTTTTSIISMIMSQHEYVHLTLAPMRLLCIGASTAFCSTNSASGIPWYANLGMKVNVWIQNQQQQSYSGVVVQMVCYFVIVLLTGICFTLESAFGPTIGLYVLVVLFLVVLVALIAGCATRRKAKKTDSKKLSLL